MSTTFPSEHELHAYVDGLLDEPRRQAVELYLAQHPETAEEVHAWQRDAQRLRRVFGAGPSLPDNPALDPARIRARRQERRRRRLALAAMLLLTLGLGSFGGWQARSWTMARSVPPMADALEAYRLVAQDRSAQLDVLSDRGTVLKAWLDQRLEHPVPLPDLSSAGYHPVGGRLFVTEQGAAAMVLYQDAAGHAMIFYVRPPTPIRRFLPSGARAEGNLLAQYGSDQRYNYAMVSRRDEADRRAAAQALQHVI